MELNFRRIRQLGQRFARFGDEFLVNVTRVRFQELQPERHRRVNENRSRHVRWRMRERRLGGTCAVWRRSLSEKRFSFLHLQLSFDSRFRSERKSIEGLRRVKFYVGYILTVKFLANANVSNLYKVPSCKFSEMWLTQKSDHITSVTLTQNRPHHNKYKLEG